MIIIYDDISSSYHQTLPYLDHHIIIIITSANIQMIKHCKALKVLQPLPDDQTPTSFRPTSFLWTPYHHQIIVIASSNHHHIIISLSYHHHIIIRSSYPDHQILPYKLILMILIRFQLILFISISIIFCITVIMWFSPLCLLTTWKINCLLTSIPMMLVGASIF